MLASRSLCYFFVFIFVHSYCSDTCTVKYFFYGLLYLNQGFFFFPPTIHKHFFLPLYEHSQRTSYVNPAKGCAAVLQRDKRKRKRLKRGISSALFKSSFYLGYVSFVCILSISDAFAQSICFSLPCRLVNQIIVPSVTLPHVQWK